jgi:hypothetical protein
MENSVEDQLYHLCWERTDTGAKGRGKALKFKELSHWKDSTGQDGNLKFTFELAVQTVKVLEKKVDIEAKPNPKHITSTKKK